PLATPPVIGDGREAMVTFTPNCATKQQAASPYNSKALERIRLLRGTLGHMPNASTSLSAIAEPAHTTIAANRDGRLAVAWLAPHGRVGIGTEATNQLYVSIGHTWGPMSTTQIVAGDSYATRVRLVWASSDELLVVYSVNKRVVVQAWKAGHGFGRPQTLGSCDFTSWGPDLTVAVGPGGRAAIAWGTQADTIEPQSPWRVYGIVRTGANARFESSHLLDPGQAQNRVPGMYDGGPNDVTAGIGTDGFTMFAWSSAELAPGRGDPVHAAVVDPDGHFNSVQELAPVSTDVTLTEMPGGGTLLQWKASRELRQASRAPDGQSFGPAGAGTASAGLIDGAELIDSATGG
ncbi:MAG TPA: hypothetical protein VN845_12585, partial [Solirubrobacteraceae bacterium]|nr:hypothetical protein [Solirubrobacteraceae bacterium]